MNSWKKFIPAALLLIIIDFPFTVGAQQGCCSHHGGVAYCDSNVGRQLCRDGSYSPSCRCQISSQNKPAQTKNQPSQRSQQPLTNTHINY